MADDHRDPNDAILDTAHRWLAVEPDPDIAVELADLIERAAADPATAPMSCARRGSPGGCSSAPPGSVPPSAPVRCG